MRVLPVSRLTTAASSMWRSSIPRASARRCSQRSPCGVARQPAAAPRAVSIASATSAAGASNALLATGSPREGSRRSKRSPSLRSSAPIRCGKGSGVPARAASRRSSNSRSVSAPKLPLV